VEVCEVVEVGAVRVVGENRDRFHTLVQPYRSITPGATKLHGYSDADVRGARSFAEVWPAFRAFVATTSSSRTTASISTSRCCAGWRRTDGVDSLVFYDTLPLVRSLSRDSAKLEDLALRFGIDAGRRTTRWTTRSRWPSLSRARAPAGHSGAQGGVSQPA